MEKGVIKGGGIEKLGLNKGKGKERRRKGRKERGEEGGRKNYRGTRKERGKEERNNNKERYERQGGREE